MRAQLATNVVPRHLPSIWRQSESLRRHDSGSRRVYASTAFPTHRADPTSGVAPDEPELLPGGLDPLLLAPSLEQAVTRAATAIAA